MSRDHWAAIREVLVGKVALHLVVLFATAVLDDVVGNIGTLNVENL